MEGGASLPDPPPKPRWQIVFARVMSVLLLPAGLLCLGVPFYMMGSPAAWAILDDTGAAFGAGVPGGSLKASYVDCTGSRSGSSSSRGIGITEYGCVIDLSEVKPYVAPTGDPWDGAATYEEGMAEYNRRRDAEWDAYVAESKARSDTSNRLERKLAIDKSGELPAVRILSAEGEPRRVGLVWGFGELAWRWGQSVLLTLLFWAFGAACLLPVKLAWWPKKAIV